MRARKRFGQHFLEPPWVDKVMETIAPLPSDHVVEIGPGAGALTYPLAARVATLVAIEIDRELAGNLSRHKPRNVRVIQGDFLQTDLTALRGDRDAAPRALRVVGNLPYNIFSPILFRLLNDERTSQPYRDATLMLQREVADRLVAEPGSKAYGVLTILVRLRADVTRLLTLPPGAFRPVPAVSSAVLRLNFRPPTVTMRDEGVFRSMVQTLFNQRRKMLLNALRPFGTPTLSAAEALAQAGLEPTRRPETLHLTELARLADLFVSARD